MTQDGSPSPYALRDQRVSEHVWLVKHLMRKHRMLLRHLESDDAFQIGLLALLKAATHFNPEVGVDFSTYGGRAVLNSWRNAVLRRSGLRPLAEPGSASDKARQVSLDTYLADPALQGLAERSLAKEDLPPAGDRYDLLYASVRELDPDQRKLIVQTALQEIPQKTLSKRLGLRKGTLSARVVRARKALRRILERKGYRWEEELT